MKQLILENSDFLLKIAYVNSGKTEKIEVYKKDIAISTGQVYKGKVLKNVIGLNGQFISLGVGEGFLQGNRLLKNGEEVLVQVKKEAIGEKQPKLTESISLAGRYVVYLPNEHKISVSNKLKQWENIDNIVDNLEKVFGNIGLIIRTEAKDEEFSRIEQEVYELQQRYRKILEKYSQSTMGLLYEEDRITKFFHHFHETENHQIIFNDKKILLRVKAILQRHGMKSELLYSEEDLFQKYAVNLNSVFQSRYRFGNISIVMETTEAFTAVDVNSGYQNRHLYLDDMALNVNLEACKHIVDLIVLKDISGVILVDFIDMKKSGYEKILLENLQREFQRDERKTSVLNITSLGIVQIIRKREKENLIEYLSVPCPVCHGQGKVRNGIMLLDELVSDIRRYLFHHDIKGDTINVKVPIYLKEELQENMRFLEEKFGYKFSIEYFDYGTEIQISQ